MLPKQFIPAHNAVLVVLYLIEFLPQTYRAQKSFTICTSPKGDTVVLWAAALLAPSFLILSFGKSLLCQFISICFVIICRWRCIYHLKSERIAFPCISNITVEMVFNKIVEIIVT